MIAEFLCFKNKSGRKAYLSVNEISKLWGLHNK